MEKRTLGRTGYDVSVLGLGGFQLTGQFGVSPAEADNIIDYAIGHGINVIDTAQSYGFGEGEAIVGRALLRHKDDRPYVFAKVGHLHELISRAMGDAAFVDADEIMRNIKHSMWVMRIDHFDLLMMHEVERQWKVDFNTGDCVVMDVLEKLKKEGVASYIGATSWDNDALAKMIKTGRVDVVLAAGGINVLNRNITTELLPAAREHNVGVVVGGCLGQNNPGLVNKNRDNLKLLRESGEEKRIVMADKLEKLYDLSDEIGLNMIQMAVRYVLSFPDIHCNPMGARCVAHVADNINSVEMGPLPASVVERINAIQDIGESMDSLEMVIRQAQHKLF